MALRSDVRILAERFFPDETRTTLPASPPLDSSMERLQRQMDSLDTYCDRPRARQQPDLGRAWQKKTPVRASPGSTWSGSSEGAQAGPLHAPLLQRDLVDEAEVSRSCASGLSTALSGRP